MRALYVSSEVYPLAKTGGLADVSAALPTALSKLGVEMSVLVPGYHGTIRSAAAKSILFESTDFLGFGPVRLIAAQTPDSGLPIWIVDSPTLFRRAGGLYQDEQGRDWSDNAFRFALFNHIAAQLSLGELVANWRADVVHANDWHAGMTPALLASVQGRRPGTLFTIHNAAYQGVFPGYLYEGLRLPANAFNSDGVEFYGGVSFLKAGIRYSDLLTTVSPTYAAELLTPEYGCGLDGLLRARQRKLYGILNGVDYHVWNPGRDSYLPECFDPGNLAGKRTCKTELQRELLLEPRSDMPLMVYVSRLTDQKMADVVLEAIPEIVERGAQLAMLGQGEPSIEQRFLEVAQKYPGRLAARIGYDEALAHRFHAGADILLHPSRFEPCGLTQLYAMRYGTLPVVTRVGGLTDTVVDASDQTLRLGTATGFVFQYPNAQAMLACVDRALALYDQPLAWRKVQYQAMSRDFGWDVSAQRYLALYNKLVPDGVQIDVTMDADPLLKTAVR